MNARVSRRHISREEREDRAMIGGKARLPQTLKQFEMSARMQTASVILIRLMWVCIGLNVTWSLWKQYQRGEWVWAGLFSAVLLFAFLKAIWKWWRAKLPDDDGSSASPTRP